MFCVEMVMFDGWRRVDDGKFDVIKSAMCHIESKISKSDENEELFLNSDDFRICEVSTEGNVIGYYTSDGVKASSC